MTFVIAILAALALVNGATAAEQVQVQACDVPESLIPAASDLTRVGKIRSERDLLEAIVFPSASFVRSCSDTGARPARARRSLCAGSI